MGHTPTQATVVLLVGDDNVTCTFVPIEVKAGIFDQRTLADSVSINVLPRLFVDKVECIGSYTYNGPITVMERFGGAFEMPTCQCPLIWKTRGGIGFRAREPSQGMEIDIVNYPPKPVEYTLETLCEREKKGKALSWREYTSNSTAPTPTVNEDVFVISKAILGAISAIWRDLRRMDCFL